MLPQHIIVYFSLALSISFPCLAIESNSILIEQVDGGNTHITQSGTNNTLSVHQKTEDPTPRIASSTKNPIPAPLGTPETVGSNNYQDNVLDNPYTSAQARVSALTKLKSAESNNPKKSLAETKKALVNESKDSGNRTNSASVTQRGSNNDLLIVQQGKNNMVSHEQHGNHHMRIIQNNSVYDKQESNE